MQPPPASPLLVALLLIIRVNEASEDEFRLLKDLRKTYDLMERPVADHRKPIRVNLRILLQQLVDVDEKNQVVTLVAWTQFTWNDYKLQWKPSEYGNITDVRFVDGLWKPDVVLFNSADENFGASLPVHFVVQENGNVLYAPPVIIRASCRIDVTWFPFDQQHCHLKYGSWTYDGTMLDLHIDKANSSAEHDIDLQYYLPNGEWELIGGGQYTREYGTPAHRVTSDFVGETYIELHFRLHLVRLTMYYGLNWIVPIVLIAIVTALGFILPPESGEKITLQLGTLVAVALFFNVISAITPPAAKSIPLISAFFAVTVLLLGASVVSTVFVISFHYRDVKRHLMSEWVRKVFLTWLPWILCLDIQSPTKPAKPPRREANGTLRCCGGSATQANTSEPLVSAESTCSLQRFTKAVDSLRQAGWASELEAGNNITSDGTDPYPNTHWASLAESVRDLGRVARRLDSRLDADENESACRSEWRQLAIVIDRLCLVIFFVTISVSTVFIILTFQPWNY